MKICAVIVTYNRLEKLKKCLAAYESQTYLPAYVVIVNNASNDGTKDYLEEWNKEASIFQKVIIHSPDNLGGSGGFCLGVMKALQLGADWIWIADDDAYPVSTCLGELEKYYNSLEMCDREEIVALCGRVNNNIGLSSLHRRRLHKGKVHIYEKPVDLGEYAKRSFDIDVFSFVGSAIKKDIVEKIGLPREDYFIYYDDSEYSMRVRKEGYIKCISTALIIHDSLENVLQKHSWKNYYMFRNKIYTYREYFPKRYYRVEVLKVFYMMIRYFNSLMSWGQFFCAVKDCRKGILGKSKRYLPK